MALFEEGTSYVDKAEQVVTALPKNSRGDFELTTSKLRNLLELTADIYNQALADSAAESSKSIRDKLQYLRVQFVYQAGREKAVKVLMGEGIFLELLDNIAKNNYPKDDIIEFCRYMEAIVAYKKYLDPNDNRRNQ